MAENHVRGSVPSPENNAKQQSGPRSLLLERCELGFGFTLRHFIVYPPESATLLGGCLSRAMDTIFVKRVAPRSPAWRAGLCTGDRLVSVNGADVGGMAYAAVVQLIQASPAQLHLVVVPKEHDILQLYFGETAHNPETNQRHGAGRRKSPENLRLSAIPARVQGVTKAKQRLSSSADSARLSLDDPAERPVSDQRRSSDGNRRDAVYGNQAWGKPLGSPGSDADAASLDSRHDSIGSRLTDSKDSLSSADSTSTLTGGDDDSVIMSRIRRSTEQKEEFLRRPVAAVAHTDRLLAREFYARPQKLKPVWPPTQPEVPRPAEKTAPRRSEPRTLGRARDEATSESENGDGADRSSASPNDERHSVPLVQLVSRRARQFERGVDGERTPLYASELARLTSKRANPGVALRRREIERRSTRELPETLEPCPESPPILAGNQLTPLTTRIHCDPPPTSNNHEPALPERGNQHGAFAQRVNHANPLRVKTEDAFLRARSNSAESWAAAFPAPRTSLLACDWPIGAGGGARESEEARHKVVRQDSYLAAVRTPVPPADASATLDSAPAAATAAPPLRPSLLPLSPLPHLPSSPLTHKTTEQLISALDAAQGQAAGDITTTVVRRQKNNHHAQTDEERLRRASYLRATNSEQTQLEHEIEQEESEQRRESQPVMLPTAEPEKENMPALREGWLNCKITVVDGKRCSDRSWRQVWAVLQANRTLMLYKEAPGQGGADNECSSLDVRGCQVDAGAVVSTRKKHALRVNTLSGSELLAQAADATDAEMWASALGQDPPTSPTTCISPTSKSRKLPAFRSRSPTGQSPASKSAKGQSDPTLVAVGGAKADTAPGSPAPKGSKGQSDAVVGGVKPGKVAISSSDTTKPRGDPTSSPKSSTWKGRVARQLRRMQGAPQPASPGSGPVDAGFTIGAALQDCAASDENPFVPMLVTKCAAVVEDRGLDIVGIYRVPGNTAAVHSLTEAVNKGFMFANCPDPRWTDVNVISSLLKLFFRKLPDALLTTELYPLFIDADKMDDPNLRIVTMRRLVRELPDHHYETLKFLCLHLKRVVAHAAANKMEARNLAIVFGPTLVRTADNNMITMVTDMSHQCRIVESLLLHVDWFFSPDSSETLELPEAGTVELEPSAMSHDLLLGNIQKVEGMRGASGGESVLAKVIGSSIISAANRKMQRKPRKPGNGGGAEEPREVSIDSAVRRHQQELDARQAAAAEPEEEASAEPTNEQPAPESVQDRLAPQPEEDGNAKTTDSMGWTYAGLSATTQERIRRFEQETKAMLQRDPSWAARRETEPPPNTTRVSSVTRTTTTHTSESRVSVTNIHVNPLASVENTESVTKRHQHEETQIRGESGEITGVALADVDNGNLKRFKTGNEQPCEPLRLMSSLRCASLDSLHDAFDRPPSELSDDGSDLLSSLTSTFDRKLKSLLGTTVTTATTTLTSSTVTLPSPIRLSPVNLASLETLASHLVTLTTGSVALPSKATRDEEPVAVISSSETSTATTPALATVAASTLAPVTVAPTTVTSPVVTTTKQRSKIPTFRDPSLHRQTTEKDKEAVRRRWLGQDADVSPSPNSSPSHAPQDSGDHPAPNNALTNPSPAPNNPSPAPNEAVLRSNLRPTTKVRRADSLSKTEKTESNRRRQEKENVKLKRRHGAKDGSIKRRHTVGGTKDLATLPWLDNRWAGEEGREGRGLRTSSPDLGRVDWREWGVMEVGKKGGVLESHV